MFDKIQSRRVASNTTVSGGNPPKISAAAEVTLMESLRRDKNLLTAISQVCVMRASTPAQRNYQLADLH